MRSLGIAHDEANCPYNHTINLDDEGKKKRDTMLEAYKAKNGGEFPWDKGNAAVPAATGAPAKGTPKGKGKGGKKGAKSRTPSPAAGGGSKDHAGRFIVRKETCPYGKDCRFSHNKKICDAARDAAA